MSDPLNPVQVEQAIAQCANRIAKGVKVVSERYSAFLAADRDYDHAYAQAYMAHDGPAHEKKYAAELETTAQREARDVAEVAWRYADRTAKAIENELMAMQSISRSVSRMYSAAGTNET